MLRLMARSPQPAPPPALINRVRTLCLALPHAVEATSYGNPAFKLGKRPFAVVDHYRGGFQLWLLCDPLQRDEALARPGWSASPYDPKTLAIIGDVELIDWAQAESLIRDSYRLAGGA